MRAVTFAAGAVTGFVVFAAICYVVGRAEEQSQRPLERVYRPSTARPDDLFASQYAAHAAFMRGDAATPDGYHA